MNDKIKIECPDCKHYITEIVLNPFSKPHFIKTGDFVDGYLEELYDRIKSEKSESLRR